MKKTCSLMIVLVVSLLSFFGVSPVLAQKDYPNRPIEIIIPYPPGGVSDTTVRYFGGKWAEFLGQPVIPVNKPGGGSALGAKFVATSKPDGYTILGGSDSPLITVRIGNKDIGYDLDSFRFLFQHSKLILYFSVKADAKWKNLNEFLAEAKQNPGRFKYASYGIGAITHYATEMLAQAAGVKLTYVPFKSSPESLTAMIGGHVEMAVTAGLSGMAGSPLLRPLAIAEEERVFDHPEVPTLKELGYPIFVNSTVALCAPKGVPEEVVKRFTDAHLKVTAKYEKEIREKITKLDAYPSFFEGEMVMKILKEREKKYKEMAPQMGIKLE